LIFFVIARIREQSQLAQGKPAMRSGLSDASYPSASRQAGVSPVFLIGKISAPALPAITAVICAATRSAAAIRTALRRT
jgi:hypothetical protein